MLTKTARQWFQEIYPTITNCTSQEAKAITKHLLHHYIGYTAEKYILEATLSADSITLQQLYKARERINNQEPLQYVLGYTHFYGYKLKLTPHVLVPRASTEAMLDYLITHHHRSNSNLLDLCTGSGCIAIVLAKKYQSAVVDAVDISTKALSVASDNARKHDVNINFHAIDLLYNPLPAKQWDVIVSNPPYIPYSEKKRMTKRVLHHEPHQALFVPDDNPLVFYKRIAVLAQQHLTPQGMVCVEIHEKMGTQIKALLIKAGFRHVVVHLDFQHKPRWVTAQH